MRPPRLWQTKIRGVVDYKVSYIRFMTFYKKEIIALPQMSSHAHFAAMSKDQRRGHGFP